MLKNLEIVEKKHSIENNAFVTFSCQFNRIPHELSEGSLNPLYKYFISISISVTESCLMVAAISEDLYWVRTLNTS